jgi:sec-independent protein translocase protein TatB
MHFADSIFIFLLALVLFGPKRLPEIGKQIGKLLAEFRRASNEFKMQIDEELRNLDREEQRKKLDAQVSVQMAAAASSDTTALTDGTASAESSGETVTPKILPPSMGEPVSTSAPFAPAAEPETTAAPFEEIDTAEAVQTTTAPSSSLNGASHSSEQESESTSLHHG